MIFKIFIFFCWATPSLGEREAAQPLVEKPCMTLWNWFFLVFYWRPLPTLGEKKNKISFLFQKKRKREMRVRALSHLFRIARVCSDRRRRHPSQPIGFKFFWFPPSFFSLLFFPLSFLSTNEKSEKAELGGGKFKKQNKIKQEDMIPSHFFSTRSGQPMSIMKSQPSCSTGGGISNKYRNKLKLFVCGGAAAAS